MTAGFAICSKPIHFSPGIFSGDKIYYLYKEFSTQPTDGKLDVIVNSIIS